ncbi:MAG: hypothetical protein JXB60_08620, partial [Candidatus Cloacimonetes bacterium]|nr:hypothetical protein [Candidatus Cloacimonadota bacterium]
LILSFSWLVIISIFIAWPAAWYASRFFLDFFAYRIDLNIQPFIIAGIITLVMTCLTVGYQTVKAAFTNPAETLKYE